MGSSILRNLHRKPYCSNIPQHMACAECETLKSFSVMVTAPLWFFIQKVTSQRNNVSPFRFNAIRRHYFSDASLLEEAGDAMTTAADAIKFYLMHPMSLQLQR